MEIRPVMPPAAAPSAPTSQSIGLPDEASRPDVTPPSAPRPRIETQEAAAPKGPRIVKVRTELRFDESINRVVGQVIDEDTGEKVLEIPPEEIRRLYAAMRELLGSLLDETA